MAHLWQDTIKPHMARPPAGRPEGQVSVFRVSVPQAFAKLLLALLVLLCAWDAAQATDFGDPGRRMRVQWRNQQLVVGVYPLPHEGYIQMAQRVMEDAAAYKDIIAFNGDRAPQKDRPVYFPIVTLKEHLRGQALRALYPEDDLTERGWSHRVTDPLENLIQLTEAYTGSKARFLELAKFNRLKNPDVLRLGTEIVIPLHWIPDALGFRPVRLKAPLALHRDEASGRLYADYTVKTNDTLYSLLLRYTDRERADEINRMARLLMEINGIKGEERLLSGKPLRMPVEWISEDYLVNTFTPRKAPPKPRVARTPPRKGSQIHVILDAGHGGKDPGAVYGSPKDSGMVYEHEVVYDIFLRLMQRLEAEGYRVHPTITDPGRKSPVDRLSMKHFGGEQVLVTPPYRMNSPKAAVNLRVYLINDIYRNLRRSGVPADNVVMISIHGDALAESLRGAMVYYPDHRLRAPEFQPRGRVYRIRKEAVPGRLLFSRDKNRAAEDVSHEFGLRIAKSFQDTGLGVARRKPVRPYYYRDGERTLPAVLRYSQVPTSVLVEVANLNNAEDRRLLMKSATREKVARALTLAVQSLRSQTTPQLARGGEKS